MRQVESFFSPTASETLYHYTGIGGLMGIVESPFLVIRASHVYYLNDSKRDPSRVRGVGKPPIKKGG